MFKSYYYIYKDSHGKWNQATNPAFIAEHPMCKAIRKSDVKDINEHLKTINKD